MKKWIENQEKFKKFGEKIQTSKDAASHKIISHSFYQTVQSIIGERRMYWFNLTVFFVVVLLMLTHCNSGKGDKKINQPTSVITSEIRKGDLPLYLKAIGTVTPIESVAVRTQINGRILKINFEEGQRVVKGQVLVEIDPQPYEALLKQYQGQLVRDQAMLENARIDLKRYKKLYSQDSIAEQTLETQIHLVEQYEGSVRADQGLVDSAKVNLQYCRIVSDISGIIGLRQVNMGNFVQTTDATPISTVNMISPITVVFSIPEDDLGKVQESMRGSASLPADAFDRKEEETLAKGHLLAMDSQIDNTTGTIKLKATFANEDHRLFPNQFVNIRLKLGALSDVLIVPVAAIQMGNEGPFIYVVNEGDHSVSLKQVTIKASEGAECSVLGDVKAGQSVVIQGMDKLQEGSVVTIAEVKKFQEKNVREIDSELKEQSES